MVDASEQQREEPRPEASANDELRAKREDAAPPSDVSSGVESFAPKRRIWPVFAMLAALIAAGATLVFLLQARSSPTRVLVAVDLDGYWWQGSEASAAVTDRFNERLLALGFDPVRGGDPEVMAVLEQAQSPQAAAGSLGAAFVVQARFEPRLLEHELEPKYYEGRARGEVSLAYAEEKALLLGSVDGWSGSRSAENAKLLLGQSVADEVFDLGIVALMQHPVVKAVLSSGSAVERGQLTKATRFLAVRNGAVDGANARYQDLLDERLRDEEGGNDQRYHGRFDDDVALGGIHDGRFLASATKIRPFYDPKSESLRYYRDLDVLFWSDESGHRRPLTDAYNLYGYPAVSRDGKVVVFVEDVFGWAKAISVLKDGQPPERLRVDPDHRYTAAAVSPQGDFAAFDDRPCRKCLSGILVIETKTGKTVFERQESQGEPSGFTWLSPTRLLVLWRPVPSEGQTTLAAQGIYTVDLTSPKPELELELELAPDTKLDAASADRSGRHVAFRREHPDGRSLAVFDTETKTLTSFDVGGGLGIPAIAPDGNAVAFEQSGEIIHFALQSGARRLLTRNRARDRYPVFAPDGARIFYESLADDPNFPRDRNVSVVVSVKTPPSAPNDAAPSGTAPSGTAPSGTAPSGTAPSAPAPKP